MRPLLLHMANFGSYCRTRRRPVGALFDRLHDEVTTEAGEP